MLTSPAFPTAFGSTVLAITVGNPELLSPSREIVSLALMMIFPASPIPRVILIICPPLVRVRLVVSMLTSPAFPTAFGSTSFKIIL